MRNHALSSLFLAAALAAAGGAAQASAVAGHFQFTAGDVRLLMPDGSERVVHKGAAVNVGETVVTGANSSAQLRMVDDAIIALRPDSRLDISVYRYAAQHRGEKHAGRGVLDLIKGGLRAITGVIGHVDHADYVVHTANATIGIRGTDHEPMYIPAAAPGSTPVGAPGTYDKVNTGGTYIQNPAGRVDVSPNQVGFAGLGLGVKPVLLKSIPSFMLPTPPLHEGRSVDADVVADQLGLVLPGFGRPVMLIEASEDGEAVPLSNPPPQIEYAGVASDLARAQGHADAFDLSQQQADGFFTNNRAISTTGYQYTHPGGSQIASGTAHFQDQGTVKVNWGIYQGGHVQDVLGKPRQVDYVTVMSASATPDSVLPTLSGTYSHVVASAMVTDGGVTGGKMGTVNIALSNGALTTYSINGLVDGAHRSWSAACASCSGGVSLADFKAQGVALAGRGPAGAASGAAKGLPVGPTGHGMLSSFALQSGASDAVAGSFVATK